MKAALLDSFGGPEHVRYGNAPDPEPESGRVLLRVRACALNHLDLWMCRGLPAYKIHLPHVLGNDIAGEVEAAGPGVEGIEPGMRAVVSPGVSCWECPACRSGRDNLCRRYSILGADGGWGGFAETVSVPGRNLLPMPENLSFEEAASFPLTFLTAWHMLKTLAELRKGETVLVVGAGSGVGVAAIQIAKLLGARVFAASTSADKLESAGALGAEETILVGKENIYRKTKKLTAREGLDVVFEHVGPATFPDALRSLRSGGRLVTCGSTAGPMVDLDMRQLFFRELKVLGAKMGTLAELREVARLFSEGKLKPVVDKAFPLKEAKEALEHLAGRRHFGKVVLKV